MIGGPTGKRVATSATATPRTAATGTGSRTEKQGLGSEHRLLPMTAHGSPGFGVPR